MVLGIPRGNWFVEGVARLNRRTSLVDYTTAKQAAEKHTGTAMADNEPQSMLPFAVSCPLPLFDKPTQTASYALSCKGCALASLQFDLALRNMEHTRDEFLEHFKECAEAKKLWAASERGKKDTGYLECDFIKRRGLPEDRWGYIAARPRIKGLDM